MTMYAVKLNARREVVMELTNEYTNHRECLIAARLAFGKDGGLLFKNSKVVIQ